MQVPAAAPGVRSIVVNPAYPTKQLANTHTHCRTLQQPAVLRQHPAAKKRWFDTAYCNLLVRPCTAAAAAETPLHCHILLTATLAVPYGCLAWLQSVLHLLAQSSTAIMRHKPAMAAVAAAEQQW